MLEQSAVTTLNGWMLSWAAFPARTLALRAREPVLLVNAQDYGESLPEPLASYDPDTWLLRMFRLY